MDPRKLQRVIVDALEDVKAQAIEVFNTTEQTSLFDRVILATGTSNRQTRALASHVRDKIKAAGGHVISVEGEDTGEWVLVDAGDAVVHIMQPAIRAYYNLEEIWGSKPVRLKRRTAGVRAADGEGESAQPAGGIAPSEDAGEAPEPDLDDVVAAGPKPAKARSAAKPASSKRPSAGKRAATASPAKKPSAVTKGTKTTGARSTAARSTAARSTPERTPATRSTSARGTSTRSASTRSSDTRGATARGTGAASAARGAAARGAGTTSAARSAGSARAKAAGSTAAKLPAKARRTRAS